MLVNSWLFCECLPIFVLVAKAHPVIFSPIRGYLVTSIVNLWGFFIQVPNSWSDVFPFIVSYVLLWSCQGWNYLCYQNLCSLRIAWLYKPQIWPYLYIESTPWLYYVSLLWVVFVVFNDKCHWLIVLICWLNWSNVVHFTMHWMQCPQQSHGDIWSCISLVIG